MKLEFSHECEIASFLYGLNGLNVRITTVVEGPGRATDYRIVDVEPDGLLCAGNKIEDYSAEGTELLELLKWDKIEEIYVY